MNNFNSSKKKQEDFYLASAGYEGKQIRVIEALEGQLITSELHLPSKSVNGNLVSDTENDVLKLAVVERYTNSKPNCVY